MAWIPHDNDNNPRTPSTYVRHDITCSSTSQGTLAINGYIRREIDCTPSVQPTHTPVLDPYGNYYRNWDGDYVKHDKDNNPV